MITQKDIEDAARVFVDSKGYYNKKDCHNSFEAGVALVIRQMYMVNRFEVIDHTKEAKGRCYVKYDCNTELQLQDNNRTLKVFVTDKDYE